MSRARLFILFEAFERDIRSIFTRYVLDVIPEDEAFGSLFQSASDKREKDGTLDAPLAEFLNLREGYDLLNSHRNLLPVELAHEVRGLTNNLDRLVLIRNRVMHARPLVPGDSYAAVSLLSQFQSRLWVELKRTLTHLSEDPSWEPVVDISSSGGFALHNLPLPDFDDTGLVGRSDEVNEIVRLLKRRREAVLTITGEGGIGKTALALEVAYQIVDDPDRPFDAVLWTSLKYERLTASGIQTIAGAVHDLTGAVRPLGATLDNTFEGGLRELASALEGFQVLIIIDNLETVGGDQFRSLYDTLPDSVNYLVTSRIGVGEYERRYPLKPLTKRDSLQLFNAFVRARRIAGLEKLSNETRAIVVEKLRFSPLAIKWFALAVEAGNDAYRLIHDQGELLEFCVRSVFDSLDPHASQLLLAMALLNRPVTIDELVLLLEKSSDEINVGMQELVRGSLVRRESFSEGGELRMQISLTDTAREFLNRRTKFDSKFEAKILEKDAEYRAAEERRANDLAERSLAPFVVRSRTTADNPTAQLLRKALIASRNGDYEDALSKVETARRLNPEFWEVDRVEGFIRSYKGDLAAATSCYENAYRLASRDEDRAVVAHFFAGHLARKVKDVNRAITLENEANQALKLPDTAVALGNYLSWVNRHAEAVPLIEPTTELQTGKGRIIAITTLAEVYQRWANYCRTHDRNPLMAFEKAKKGADIALAALAAGTADDRLRDKGADCIKEAIIAIIECLRSSVNVRDASEWLDAVSGSMIRFGRSPIWNSLLSHVNALAATPRCPGGARRLAETAREVDDQVWGRALSSRPTTTERLVGEVVSLHRTFGFLSHQDYPNNLFFHAGSVLDGNGLESLEIGCRVSFVVAESNRGDRAEQIDRVF